MAELTFYHQVRADGGERTGIDYDGSGLGQFFQEGDADHDPALLWFVDVRCEGDRLPDDLHGARDWFLKNKDFFVDWLIRIADENLNVGFDVEYKPYQREIEDGPDGAHVLVVVSAIRRLVAREIAENIRRIAHEWTALLDRLVPLSEMAR